MMPCMSGDELRAERERAGVRAVDMAVYLDRHPAAVTRLEQSVQVEPRLAERYLRAIVAIGAQRAAVRRELIRELAAR